MRMLQSPSERVSVSSIQLVEGQHAVSVPEDDLADFNQDLNDAFFKSGKFTQGSELVLEYRFVFFNRGSQFARWAAGFGAGEGEIIVETIFKKPDGTVVSQSEVNQRVSAGAYGGAFRPTLKKAARKIAEYAEATFLAN